jgi:UDP-N-acetylmuramoyl-L-alanyl-D-glutamate--2,6-diaminopimelate ligase
MELTDLINALKVIQVAGDVQRKEISRIVYDSRAVSSNSIFVAIKGYKFDGHNYIIDAINKGAAAIILDNDSVVPEEIFIHSNVTKILVKDSRVALAELSKSFFKDPSSKINLIGVTGTNGKTTTTWLIKNIFDNAGVKTGLIGTIANCIGDTKIESKLTTPESSDLNYLLHQMIIENCNVVAMEVSSHSLFLNRTYGLNFKYAVFTNITPDHLDFHQTFENYINAKKILFDRLSEKSLAVVNVDDENFNKIIKDCKGKILRYGKSNSADYRISDITIDLTGTRFNLIYQNDVYQVELPLIGEFNAYNATAAFAICHNEGIDTDTIIQGLKNSKQVPGRFEIVSSPKKKVIVDYSHTPDSLEKAIQSLRKIVGKNKIITVFGCGGDRDKTKRPIMGKIATELSDEVIITSDNPRTENPKSIIDDILKGIDKSNYKVIENREEAIKTAIQDADENTSILIAGKGHENYQEINGVRYHFSDTEIARKYLV